MMYRCGEWRKKILFSCQKGAGSVRGKGRVVCGFSGFGEWLERNWSALLSAGESNEDRRAVPRDRNQGRRGRSLAARWGKI
jgi:hypothetical protein